MKCRAPRKGYWGTAYCDLPEGHAESHQTGSGYKWLAWQDTDQDRIPHTTAEIRRIMSSAVGELGAAVGYVRAVNPKAAERMATTRDKLMMAIVMLDEKVADDESD